MNRRLYFIILQLVLILGEDINEFKGLRCCPRIRVSSTSYAQEHRPSSMGIYFSLPGKTNNRLVYKHNTGDPIQIYIKKELTSFAVILTNKYL